MIQKHLAVLEMCPLFFGLDAFGIDSLLPCFSPVLLGFAKGEILFVTGGQQLSFGIVLEGEIQVIKEETNGNRLIVGIFGPGELFGEVAAFAGRTLWPNTVIAGTDGSVLMLPIAKISRPCGNSCDFHQQLIRNMLNVIAGKAMLMNNRLGFLQLRGMREKLAAYLLEQARLSGSQTFLLPMNRDQMADFLSVSRPSMSRELGRMKDEGLIDFFKSSFIIKNDQALRQVGGS